jgi:hypothetical protein
MAREVDSVAGLCAQYFSPDSGVGATLACGRRCGCNGIAGAWLAPLVAQAGHADTPPVVGQSRIAGTRPQRRQAPSFIPRSAS